MTNPARLAIAAAVTACLAGTAAASPDPDAPAVIQRAPRTPRIGIMADAGVPDGATLSLVVRPVSFLRLNLGGGYNGISPGVRAGATLVPLKRWFSPVLAVDAGRYFEGDANPLYRRISGDEMFSSPLLERVGYDYADAHLGLELGRRWFTFYVHAGVSRVSGQVRQIAAATDGDAVSFSEDPSVKITSVSARLGFVFYLIK